MHHLPLILALALLSGAPTAATGPTPVLVELFTSEGCSSCPAADRLLTRLQRDQPVQDVEIVALGQHVDYWNGLGWNDRFSAAEFTARQASYGVAFRRTDVYTPQMVVDGSAELVGGDEARVLAAIRAAAATPKLVLGVRRLAVVGGGPRDLRLRIEGTELERAGVAGEADLLLALTEDGLASRVRKGENAGRSLRHDCVVRRLLHLAEVDLSAEPFFVETPVIPLSAGWNLRNVRAVVFLQQRPQRRVVGVTALCVDRPPTARAR